MVLLDISGLQDWALFLGHFHPVVVHLPIGMLVLAALIHLFYKKSSTKELSPIFLWTFISALISCGMGYGLSLSGGYEEETLFLHQYLGISVAILSGILAYTSRNWSGDESMKKTFKPLLYLGIVAITLTGHLGGNLTHGSDYLWKELPSPLRSWFGLPEKESKNESGEVVYHIKDLKKAVVYQDLVQPVLKQKCWSCHNAEKQKGDLRMDSPQFLVEGGENGPILEAGKPDDSEMIKRILLDESNEDHMPPKGKIGLSSDEIAVLHWWIKAGANFKSQVAQLPKEEKINRILDKLIKGTGEKEGQSKSPIFSKQVDEASTSDIEGLRALKLLVMPMAQDIHYLEVNAVNNQGLNDKDLEKLEGVQEQLASLKLGKTKISDAFVESIKEAENLIRLQLEYTSIGDQAIKSMSNFKFLEVLNLLATKVTDACIADLSKIKSLKKVYVWQTKISEKGIATLHQRRPDLQIISGTKVQWPLKLDTMELVQPVIK